VILISAIRGWLRGFVSQVVRLGGLVACVYAAAPVRDQVRPHVAPHLPSIQPEFVDRLLWWVAAIVSYLVIVGTTTILIKLLRRPVDPALPSGKPVVSTGNANDRLAGFLLGAAKGAAVACVLAAALQKYGLEQLRSVDWVQQQVEASRALAWTEQYQPVPKVWDSAPVQNLVRHIQRMGLNPPAPASPSAEKDLSGAEVGEATESPSVTSTETRPPRLTLAPAPASSASAVDASSGTARAEARSSDPELEAAIREVREARHTKDPATSLQP
jgi:uncharacterized membrane protein required for colicin V production